MEILTEREAAAMLRCSVETLRRKRRRGLISSCQEQRGVQGSRVTYLAEDVRDFQDKIRHAAEWGSEVSGPRAKTCGVKRKPTVHADQREHDEALRLLREEFGIKINPTLQSTGK